MDNSLIISQINNAITAHGSWRSRLESAVSMGQFNDEIAKVSCDNACVFGKWMHGPLLDDELRQGVPYQVILRLHREFHLCAGKVAYAVNAGNLQQANNMLQGEFYERSEKLKRALNKWRNELKVPQAA